MSLLQFPQLRFLTAGLFACLAAAHAAAASDAGPIRADAEGAVDFTVPSNNIECRYTPPGGTRTYTPPRNEAELSCDRAAPAYLHFSMGAHGAPVKVQNPGEQPCCSLVPVLAYGAVWSAGPFTCRSETTGLTCRRADGRGFLISRAKAVTF